MNTNDNINSDTKEKKDTTSRRYQLTINNPLDKEMTHKQITEILHKMKPLRYYCISDEIGASNTLHTHFYVVFSTPVHFSTLKKAFPMAHIEVARGTSQENRDYILKNGEKYKDKQETSIEGSFEEWGEMPTERQGHRSDLSELYEQIKEGASDIDILENNASNMRYLSYIDKVRQSLRYEETKNLFRNLDVTYIWGKTGVGKTRYVMERYGYENVFRITDYSHAFDQYRGQDVICFDEFHGQFQIQAMLQFLDGYPVELPCRYANKWAQFHTVFILSNVSLDMQYKGIQEAYIETWCAFLRRIHSVQEFLGNGKVLTYNASDFTSCFPKNKREKLLSGQQVSLSDSFTEIEDSNNPFT